MQPETHEANTETWIKASQDLNVKPFVEGYMATVSVNGYPVPTEQGLYDELKKIGALFPIPAAGVVGPQLEMELQAWDLLSDEALRDFEAGLE